MFSKVRYNAAAKSDATRMLARRTKDKKELSEGRDIVKRAYILPRNASNAVIEKTAAFHLSRCEGDFEYMCPSKEDFEALCEQHMIPPMALHMAIHLSVQKHLEQARVMKRIDAAEKFSFNIQNHNTISAGFQELLKDMGGRINIESDSHLSLESNDGNDSYAAYIGIDYKDSEQRAALDEALDTFDLHEPIPLDKDLQYQKIRQIDETTASSIEILIKPPFTNALRPFAYSRSYVYEALYLHVQMIFKGALLVTGDAVPDLEYLSYLHLLYDPEDTLELKQPVFQCKIGRAHV